MIRKKKKFPRVPLPRQTGGAHTPAKGGKYCRDKEKDGTRREIKAELR